MKYSNSSFKGTYGFSVVVGANVAIGLSLATFDGRGNFKGTQKLNVSGAIVTSPIYGTYTINPDGTGTATVTFGEPGGGTTQSGIDLVILEAKSSGSRKLATELQGVLSNPGPGGGLGLAHFKLLP
jgi:hypothetical protein